MLFPLELKSQTIIFVILTIITYIVYNLKRKYDYWKNRNVPHVGFFKDSMFSFGKHRGDVFIGLYQNFPTQPYVGYYHSTRPYLLVRDNELVRSILVKDFSHFVNHGHKIFKEDTDPLFACNLFHLNDQKWRSIRAKLAPIFTSGKMRRMSVLMDACTVSLGKYLERTLAENGGSVEVREVFLKFAMDVIGVCAFGLKCNAVDDDDSEFKQVSNKWNTPWTLVKLSLMEILEGIHPRLISLLNVRLIDAESQQFFYNMTRETSKHRIENATKRDDFLQLLINLREEEQKLIKEENQNNDNVSLNDSETLRLHPNVTNLDRICTKPFQVPESSFVIKKNELINIPTEEAIHFDPELWPDPKRFDPERFNEENKSRIVPCSYLPFGDGPRICIGNRFALMEIKASLAYVLSRYSVHPTEKTEIPITKNPKVYTNIPNKGVHLRFQKRDGSNADVKTVENK